MRGRFCDTLKLAFEFDRIQHFEYPNPFHQTYRQLKSQRKRDEKKNYKYKICEVIVLRMTYDIQILKDFIMTSKRKISFESCLTYLKH